jgi:hypothetical protein
MRTSLGKRVKTWQDLTTDTMIDVGSSMTRDGPGQYSFVRNPSLRGDDRKALSHTLTVAVRVDPPSRLKTSWKSRCFNLDVQAFSQDGETEPINRPQRRQQQLISQTSEVRSDSESTSSADDSDCTPEKRRRREDVHQRSWQSIGDSIDGVIEPLEVKLGKQYEVSLPNVKELEQAVFTRCQEAIISIYRLGGKLPSGTTWAKDTRRSVTEDPMTCRTILSSSTPGIAFGSTGAIDGRLDLFWQIGTDATGTATHLDGSIRAVNTESEEAMGVDERSNV